MTRIATNRTVRAAGTAARGCVLLSPKARCDGFSGPLTVRLLGSGTSFRPRVGEGASLTVISVCANEN